MLSARRGRVAAGVEPLEGRALLSGDRFFFSHSLGIEVNNTSDVRVAEPQFGSGVAVNVHPGFVPFYRGPREPELLATAASARVTIGPKHVPSTIILTGTVAGPIDTKPKTAGQGAVYTFGFDTGGASKTGPFPGRPNIRFDAVVIVSITPAGVAGSAQFLNSITNQPTTPTTLKASAIAIKGDTLTVTLPANVFPSSGHAINQWNVVFFPRVPSSRPKITDVASLVPQFTSFQVAYPPFRANESPG